MQKSDARENGGKQSKAKKKKKRKDFRAEPEKYSELRIVINPRHGPYLEASLAVQDYRAVGGGS